MDGAFLEGREVGDKWDVDFRTTGILGLPNDHPQWNTGASGTTVRTKSEQ